MRVAVGRAGVRGRYGCGGGGRVVGVGRQREGLRPKDSAQRRSQLLFLILSLDKRVGGGETRLASTDDSTSGLLSGILSRGDNI